MSSACPNATEVATATPTLEAVHRAEVLRDLQARRLADALVDGTLAERPWLVEAYREYRDAHESAHGAWSAAVAQMLAEHPSTAGAGA